MRALHVGAANWLVSGVFYTSDLVRTLITALPLHTKHQKCGGEKPACLQCVRGNRAHECLYEDQRQTPTHKLHARISELQALVDGYERLIAQGTDISTPPPPPTHDQAIGTTQWTQAPSLSNGAGNGITSHSAPFNRTDYDRSLYSSSMSPTNQLSGQTRNALSPTNPTTSYLEANASAFSTLINPLDGSLMPSAQEEWNTEALPRGIEQRMLCVYFCNSFLPRIYIA